MAQNDEFDLRELLGDGEDNMPTLDITSVVADIPASELNEVENTLKSVQCFKCACFMVGMVNDKRVCRHHKDNPNDANCPECARRNLINSPDYIANGHKTPPVHPVAPSVIPTDVSVAPIMSPVKDGELIAASQGIPADELDREYHECFNATMVECKDMEPEQLQEIRHKHLRMIRRAKIMNQAIRVLEEGKLQLIEIKRRQKILEKDAEFMKSRGSQKKLDDASGGKKSSASKSTGMSQAEKQIKQFCKLNMPDEAIISTLKAVGTGVPENVAELIAKHRK